MLNIKYSEKLVTQNNNNIFFISKTIDLNNISFLKNIKFKGKIGTFRDKIYIDKKISLKFNISDQLF